MDRYTYEDLRDRGERVLEEAFHRIPRKDDGDNPFSALGLWDLYEPGGSDAFGNHENLVNAINRARFRLLNAILPNFALLVVDEAHKLKNPLTVRSQAVTNVLVKKYDKTVFLTATPFQLNVQELQQVFRTFSYARTAPKDFSSGLHGLFEAVRAYQEAYGETQRDWEHEIRKQFTNFMSGMRQEQRSEIRRPGPQR